MVHLQVNESISATVSSSLINQKLLEDSASETLSMTHRDSDLDLSIVLTDDRQLQELNLEYLDIDAPTDVLSFPSGEQDPDTGKTYIGDVIISYERAVKQAESANVPPEHELCMLVVHGVLHLLGYDHTNEHKKSEMWAVQDKVLQKMDERIRKISRQDL